MLLSLAPYKCIGLSFYLDSYSLVFLLLFSAVGYTCYVCRIRYVHPVNRLFTVSYWFFIASIGLLILRNDVYTLFLAWDGLGLSSSLLVAYYFSGAARAGGTITLLFNRVGDVALLGSILFFTSGIVSLPNGSQAGSNRLLVLLFIALSSKRAQIPFSSWLPAAMSAPTTVTALVHSRTVVTAGVWVWGRSGCYQAMGPVELTFCSVLSGMTLFFSALSSTNSFDIKRIAAIRTIANLSLMLIFLMGGGGLLACFTHIIIHAITKSWFFLRIGFLMLDAKHAQDIRQWNCLSNEASFLFLLALLSQGPNITRAYSQRKHMGIGPCDPSFRLSCLFFSLSLVCLLLRVFRLIILLICSKVSLSSVSAAKLVMGRLGLFLSFFFLFSSFSLIFFLSMPIECRVAIRLQRGGDWVLIFFVVLCFQSTRRCSPLNSTHPFLFLTLK